MSWVYLFIAGIFEIVWAIALKYSNGFKNLIPSIITIVGMIISFGFLSISLKNLSVGTAYAIWTGIGAIGTVIIGAILFKDIISPIKILFLVMIIGGIIGLKFTS